ncbi:hypothetical protein GH714_016328 [Hevea brasiliensis]|uniref:Pentatricopeptide repeat-containing protein n=1 Tax=Hevea brasiliensis TaxID=3981 RepID=A0A6A6M0Z5_HEVBR|nr:hypothetical protein GH714_016328 [Hevea brasiliensis]
MLQIGFSPNSYTYVSLIEFARKVFDEMTQRDSVSWNSIINLYAGIGELGVAHDIFDVMIEEMKMMNSGLRGNDRTIVGVLSACGKSARLKEGSSVHGFLIRTSLKLSIILDTSLIDMYSKCQKVELARRIFDSMLHKNLICWNAMILGHCIHGNPEDGLNLFAEMISGDGEAIPDEVTYIGLLCACARAGLLTEGRNFFSQMMHKYSLKPNFAHYWCMANLYAGVGLVQEAENILRNIAEGDENVLSESLVWANLLSLCRFQANATFGERIAKCLINMEPWNFSHIGCCSMSMLWQEME